MLIAGNIRQICQFETNFFLRIGKSESQANVDYKDAVYDVDSLVPRYTVLDQLAVKLPTRVMSHFSDICSNYRDLQYIASDALPGLISACVYHIDLCF